MPETEAQKRASKKWKENNKEKMTQYYKDYNTLYHKTDKYKTYTRTYKRKLYHYDAECKRLRHILL